MEGTLYSMDSFIIGPSGAVICRVRAKCKSEVYTLKMESRLREEGLYVPIRLVKMLREIDGEREGGEYCTGVIKIKSKGEGGNYKEVKAGTKMALLMPILAETETNRKETMFSRCVTVLEFGVLRQREEVWTRQEL